MTSYIGPISSSWLTVLVSNANLDGLPAFVYDVKQFKRRECCINQNLYVAIACDPDCEWLLTQLFG